MLTGSRCRSRSFGSALLVPVSRSEADFVTARGWPAFGDRLIEVEVEVGGGSSVVRTKKGNPSGWVILVLMSLG